MSRILRLAKRHNRQRLTHHNSNKGGFLFMDDRYLFRGKSIKDNDWIIGSLNISNKVTPYILPRELGNDFELTRHMIIDSTIGQCTGLKDKNGVLIFEFDIVQVNCYSYHEPTISRCGIIDISWRGCELRTPESEYSDVIHLSDLQGSYKTEYEIIGNKFDNPELLKDGEPNA